MFSKILISNSADRFVGFKYEGTTLKIYSPLGYNYGDKEQVGFNLHKMFKKFEKSKSYNKSLFTKLVKNDDEIKIIFEILNDYNNFGVFKPINKKENRVSGQFNLKKSILRSSSKFQILESDFIFLKKSKEDNEITKIHKFAINFCYNMIFFNVHFTSLGKPHHKENEIKKFIMFEIKRTYKDSDLRILKNLFDFYFNFFFKQPSISRIAEYGTYNFEYIWEHMIDDIFRNEDITKYSPQATWYFYNGGTFESSTLRIDTIHINSKNQIYVLDSKYYKYGVTFNPLDLPLTKDIEKQITYFKYVSNILKEDEIINAFILPSDLKAIGYTNTILNHGYANVNWEIDNLQASIRLLLIDTTSVILKYIENKKMLID
jgi:hypothetical protein